MHFTKMHALGNDFIILDDRTAKLRRLSQLSEKMCDRRFGIGADQLLLLCHSTAADFRMRIFNADGSEVEMCGNGLRCLGKYIWDKIHVRKKNISHKKSRRYKDHLIIETLAGFISVYRKGNSYKADMGEPV